MAATSVRGTSRIVEKLEKAVKDGQYYEAHQMYRTLYFRLSSQNKYKELLDMLYNGSILFLERDQQTSGADLALLLVDTLSKSETKEYSDWIPKLCRIFCNIQPASLQRDQFLANVVRWSAAEKPQGHPLLHQNIAQIYWNEKNYQQARHHYIYSKDGLGCARLLIEFQSQNGFKSEADLFIAQAVLQYLCLKNKNTASQTFTSYTEQHPRIKKSGPPYLLPLLNFLWFLLQAIESRKLQTFAVLCEQYEPSIKRDPNYIGYLDKIGQIFFGLNPPQQQKAGGIFGNILESFLAGLGDESDDESSSDKNTAKASTSRNMLENTELD